MNEMETVLSTRLHTLAEELTPQTDLYAQAVSARARFRHQRRARVGFALTAAAVVAVVVGVSTVTGALSSARDPGRDGAGPGPVTASAPGTPVETANDRPEPGRLEGLADELRATLEARAVPLSLDAPAGDQTCPARAPTLDSAFGAILAEHSSGAAAGDCVWRTPTGDLQVTLGFMAGGTVDQIHADVDGEVARSGCYPTALPGSLTFTALALCEEDGATGWHLRIMEAGGSGFWLLNVTVGDQRPEDPAMTVAAVLDAADADL